MNTENTKTQFESKEHYQNFLAAWSTYFNSDKVKPTYRKINCWNSADSCMVEDGGTLKIKGALKAEHFMLYNMLRDRPQTRGFTLRTNSNKYGYTTGNYINQGMYEAYYNLKCKISLAQKTLESANPATLLEKAKARFAKFSGKSLEDNIDIFKKQQNGQVETLKTFLEPFGETVSLQMLASIELEEITPTFAKEEA